MTDQRNPIYLSFFMFTTDLQPNNPKYTDVIIQHMKEVTALGYNGFDLPIAPPSGPLNSSAELRSYQMLRDALDKAGLTNVGVTTNVGATQLFDPSAMHAEDRQRGLAYLKSRVDITKALRGTIMAGPIVVPYGVFPVNDIGHPIWSDELQTWLAQRYANAQPIIQELGDYAASQGISIAIEPVDHWETPGPNMVHEVVRFLEGVSSPQVGVCVDSAHVVLGSDGPKEYVNDIQTLHNSNRLNYVHISAPDRGVVANSWIPWQPLLNPLLGRYNGPMLIEVFNAIPAFLNSLRLTRRKFPIPHEDKLTNHSPNAYTVAREAIETLQRELSIRAEPTIEQQPTLELS